MWRDEKAVSPVIGVILMVAITVILAAVIASFVFGLGAKAPKSAPQAQLVTSADADTKEYGGTNLAGVTDIVIIEHQGGENVPWNDVKVIIEGRSIEALTTADKVTDLTTIDNTTTKGWYQSEISSNEFWEPGEKLVLAFNESALNGGVGVFEPGETVTIKVLHTPSNQMILSTQVPAQ